MLEQLPTLLSAVIGDGFAIAKLNEGNLAGFGVAGLVSSLLARRAETARDIIIQEIRRGERLMTSMEIEEGVAVAYRYFRAAQEGAARLNLRLLAKVIAERARLGNLVADEFLADADILASLRRNEIVLLATMYQAGHNTLLGDPREWAEKQLIPTPFADKEELMATAGAVVRTGLIRTESGYGSIDYSLTHLIDRLVSLADIESALRTERR
jgi:hypothetical protein